MSAYSLSQTTMPTSSSAAPEYIFDICTSPDGDHHCISLSDGSIGVFSAHNFDSILSGTIQAHSDRINSVKYSPIDSNIIVTASADHSVCAWDMRVSFISSSSSPSSRSRPVQKIILPGEVSSASVGVNGNLLAAAYENSLHFYDFRQFILEKTRHQETLM